MLTDRTERLPEALRMGWRPEPTPCPLALAGGLMTVFRAVIEALMRPMRHLMRRGYSSSMKRATPSAVTAVPLGVRPSWPAHWARRIRAFAPRAN